MTSKKVYSIMFGLKDYAGHIFQYHLSIKRVCNLNNWHHIGLIPINCNLKDLPKDWQKALGNSSLKKKYLKQNFISCWKNYKVLKKLFKRCSENDVIFLEHFSVFNILSLILALLSTRPKCNFWILHRFFFQSFNFKNILYKFLHKAIQIKSGKSKLLLLTDSDLLANKQAKLFNKSVMVLPIPHTKTFSNSVELKNSNTIDLWWPGGSTRWDKGLEYINLLSKQISREKNVRLILAENVKGKIAQNKNIIFLPTCLNSDKYYAQMRSTNIVILPYIPKEYRLRTSGIFVEAITAGTKVITFQNTWMGYELEKYKLPELAISPKEFCIDKILKIAHLDLTLRFDFMVKEYIKFHSEHNFAKILKSYAFLY